MTLRFLTAGESHGQALVAILDGFPAGLPVGEKDIRESWHAGSRDTEQVLA